MLALFFALKFHYMESDFKNIFIPKSSQNIGDLKIKYKSYSYIMIIVFVKWISFLFCPAICRMHKEINTRKERWQG
ncbi:hypothetical protein CSN29_21660 [Salmonella enterica subsp. diarizonae]|nr:hypothetical protein [Salmonella enterica]ECC3883422.1 hypothetical protein [Salmonella enterica subsp. diarizonae]ECJ4780215.1 hypothetical protein [Salmonella enterica subsp. diarizonae]